MKYCLAFAILSKNKDGTLTVPKEVFPVLVNSILCFSGEEGELSFTFLDHEEENINIIYNSLFEHALQNYDPDWVIISRLDHKVPTDLPHIITKVLTDENIINGDGVFTFKEQGTVVVSKSSKMENGYIDFEKLLKGE